MRSIRSLLTSSAPATTPNPDAPATACDGRPDPQAAHPAEGAADAENQPEPPQADTAPPPAVATRDRRLLLASIGAVAVGLLMIHQALDAPMRTAPLPARVPASVPASVPAAHSVPPPSPAPAPGPALPHSPPTRLRIPQIHVDAPFSGLTLDSAGALNAPPPNDRNLVGWYQDGAAPGEIGTSVVAGHVDTKTGPAVFLLLSTLQPGNTVDITRADRTVATFSVDSVQAFPKDHFPDQLVYADAPDAQLRLITCGGAYDRNRQDYVENVVVFAHLQSFRQE